VSAGHALGAVRHPHPPLADGVIVLRALEARDAPALARAAADPDIARFAYSEWFPAGDESAALAFVVDQLPALAERGRAVMLGIFPREGGGLLGATALTNLDSEGGCGELGCWIVADARGRGLGERASRMTCRWGFSALGLHRIQALTDPANARAERGLRAMGFVPEGILRGIDRRPDGHHDRRCWSLLASDHAALAAL